MTAELSPIAQMLGLLSPLSLIILGLLCIFSVVSWSIMLSKWRLFRTQKLHNTKFLAVYAKTHDIEQLRKVAASTEMEHSTLAMLFLRGVDGIEYRVPTMTEDQLDRTVYRADLDRLMDQAIQEQSERLESLLPVLATIGNVSPFVGLFGTVLGIINAFAAIGEQASANIRTVAPGMAEALIATAAGLFAAIPAVIFYNFCLTNIRREVQRMESFSVDFLMTVAANFFRSVTRSVDKEL